MRRTFFVTIEGNKHEVSVKNVSGSEYLVLVNGKEIKAFISSKDLRRSSSRSSALDKKSGEVLSPYTGLITKVFFEDGDLVKEGDLIFTIEAMKMENQVIAQSPGKICEIQAIEGSEVKKGAKLCSIK